MSNALAIANVTQALVNLLDDVKSDFPNTQVTARPLHEVSPTQFTHGLNLFLYRTETNDAWRNMDLPSQTRPGERGQPPLPLNLYYLLSVFSANHDEVEGHKVLGYAMSILHDHAVLSQAELQSAMNASDLHRQIERIRITYEPLSLEDMFRIWGSINSEYRLTVAYQASVVLIESNRPTIAALPVLSPIIAARARLEGLTAFPTITSISIPHDKSAAELGETVIIHGYNLHGTTVSVRFESDRLSAPIDLIPASRNETQLSIDLPNTAADFGEWVPGLYRVRVTVITGGQARVTNEIPLQIAPRISSISPNPAAYSGSNITLTVDNQPNINSTQRISLLLGSHEISADTVSGSVATVSFTFTETRVPVGTYFPRLRVDGVDSVLIDYSTEPLSFDTSQQVEIQP